MFILPLYLPFIVDIERLFMAERYSKSFLSPSTLVIQSKFVNAGFFTIGKRVLSFVIIEMTSDVVGLFAGDSSTHKRLI